jgi:hypothetical protein
MMQIEVASLGIFQMGVMTLDSIRMLLLRSEALGDDRE